MTSSLKVQLVEQLQRFDDEAFAALANRGLLRRAQKDVQKASAVIVEDDAKTLIMTFGEHRITFDARGPAQAQCSCPASGVCHHILAAALTLRGTLPEVSMPAAPQATTGPVAATDPASPVPDAASLAVLQAALIEVPTAQLVKHAGKAGYRWAWHFVQDLPEEGVELGGERHLVIGFRAPRVRFRYMGGGVDALIADVPLKALEKYQVAAILAYRRACGVAVDPPAAVGPKALGLDLGKDHALPDTGDAAAFSSRGRLLDATRQLLGECLSLGLSHLSLAIQERFATVAVWAQGAECYRLAMLLRRIADHIEQLLERTGGADEHRLLDELSIAYGLVEALAGASEPIRPSLLGRARTTYEKGAEMDLIGVGAFPWRSGSGYVGLTLVFWSEATEEFHTCTDARPESLRSFNPVARYKAAGPWAGLGAPQQATGRQVLLTNPLLNAEGRISASEQIQATIRSGAIASRLRPMVRWSEVAQRRASLRQSLLATPQPLREWVALKPQRFGPAQFDRNRQVLLWAVFDDEEKPLAVELAYSDLAAHAIERIERCQREGLPEGAMLIGRLRAGASGTTTVEPLSLILPGRSNEVDALYFDDPPKSAWKSVWSKLFGARLDSEEPAPTAAVDARPEALRQFRLWIRPQAERGIPPLAQEGLRRTLGEYLGRCADAGLSSFTAMVPAALSLPEGLLRANYLALQTEWLLGEDVASV